MSLKTRISHLEDCRQRTVQVRRVPVELLTGAQLEAMCKESGHDLTLLTDAELNALRDCYTEAGDYVPGRVTPELAATL